MFMVPDVIELLLVFTLFFTGLALMYLAQRWIDGKQRDEAVDDED